MKLQYIYLPVNGIFEDDPDITLIHVSILYHLFFTCTKQQYAVDRKKINGQVYTRINRKGMFNELYFLRLKDPTTLSHYLTWFDKHGYLTRYYEYDTENPIHRQLWIYLEPKTIAYFQNGSSAGAYNHRLEGKNTIKPVRSFTDTGEIRPLCRVSSEKENQRISVSALINSGYVKHETSKEWGRYEGDYWYALDPNIIVEDD